MKLKTFYAEHESFILGTGFIVILLAFWESVPLWYTLPKGMALFFTTPSKVAAAFQQLLINGEIEKHFYVSAIAFLAGLGLSIIVGLRLAIGRAILGVVVGEFFGSSQGLGYMIASAATNYKVDVVFVGVTIFMGLSVILTLAVKHLESRLASWRPETAKTF